MAHLRDVKQLGVKACSFKAAVENIPDGGVTKSPGPVISAKRTWCFAASISKSLRSCKSLAERSGVSSWGYPVLGDFKVFQPGLRLNAPTYLIASYRARFNGTFSLSTDEIMFAFLSNPRSVLAVVRLFLRLSCC